MPDWAVKECRGRIDIDHLLAHFRVQLPKYFSSSFLSSLPVEYTQVNFLNIQNIPQYFLKFFFALSGKVGRHLGKNGLNNP